MASFLHQLNTVIVIVIVILLGSYHSSIVLTYLPTVQKAGLNQGEI